MKKKLIILFIFSFNLISCLEIFGPNGLMEAVKQIDMLKRPMNPSFFKATSEDVFNKLNTNELKRRVGSIAHYRDLLSANGLYPADKVDIDGSEAIKYYENRLDNVFKALQPVQEEIVASKSIPLYGAGSLSELINKFKEPINPADFKIVSENLFNKLNDKELKRRVGSIAHYRVLLSNNGLYPADKIDNNGSEAIKYYEDQLANVFRALKPAKEEVAQSIPLVGQGSLTELVNEFNNLIKRNKKNPIALNGSLKSYVEKISKLAKKFNNDALKNQVAYIKEYRQLLVQNNLYPKSEVNVNGEAAKKQFQNWLNTEFYLTTTPAIGEDAISFDRESMSIDEGDKTFVEGYWASSADPQKDNYKGKYPWPKSHKKPWPGKKDFMKKLNNIERHAKTLNLVVDDNRCYFLYYVRYKGYAHSRLDGTNVKNGQFYDVIRRVSWPEGYSSHYIDKYNVIPSKAFYRYVMNLPEEVFSKDYNFCI